MPGEAQIHRLIWTIKLKLVDYLAFLIISKVLDVRRRKPAPAKAGGGTIEGNAA